MSGYISTMSANNMITYASFYRIRPLMRRLNAFYNSVQRLAEDRFLVLLPGY